MCLLIDESIHPKCKPLIAKKAIPVYKVIRLSNRSIYQAFEYTPNKMYKLKRKFEEWGGAVDAGFHAYLVRDEVFRRELIEAGGYASGKRTKPPNADLYKVVRFTIPKGAEYFIGVKNDIVSNKIRSETLNRIRYERGVEMVNL